MCTNYRAPNEDPGISELKLGIGDLYQRTPWEPEIWPDYAAPIVRAGGDCAEAVIANFGMIPKDHQPPGKKYMTVNARSETVGEKPAYRTAWRAGHRCLIPARWIYEPNWETGKHVRYRIGVADWQPYCVAGIWRAWKGPDGAETLAMAMLTLNADEHPVMKHMHKPGDEKRSVVILRPSDYDEWLHTKNVEAARALLQLFPADEMVAAEAPKERASPKSS
ncbi:MULTISPECIES: SOS response-associated peptidase [unclassified Burkholderia]|uniref:SOS response-associated peptidase n=1 Tax=unclassified Burkholderia TaxID=2613784 RepID=UPI002AB0D409|nr:MULTISPECIES: SOS response-associated peptidase family protein [unclassified Burkholderia]